MRRERVRIGLRVNFPVLNVENCVVETVSKAGVLWVLGSVDAASHRLSLVFVVILSEGVAFLV